MTRLTIWPIHLIFAFCLAAPASTQGQEPPVGASRSNPAVDEATLVVEREQHETVLVSGTEVRPAAAEHASDPAPAAAAQALPSAAERIAQLERTLESDRARLRELQATLDAPDGEFAQAKDAFLELDGQRTALQEKLAELQNAKQPQGLKPLQARYEALEKWWALAKERFELALGERKVIEQSIHTLTQKLESDRNSLDQLKGSDEPLPLTGSPTADNEPSAKPATAGREPTAAAQSPEPAGGPAASAMPVANAALAGNPLPAASPPAASVPPPSSESATEEIDEELQAASEAAQQSHIAARAAEANARNISERIEFLRRDIHLQRELRDTARKNADNSEKMLQSLNEELFGKLMTGEKVGRVQTQIRAATDRLHDSRLKARRKSTQLDELQSRLAQLQSEQLSAARDAAHKRETADRAQQTVDRLQNPFAIRNLLQWLIDHGLGIVGIVISLCVFLWMSRKLEARLVALTAQRGLRGSRAERENRARTLLGVFRNVANIVVVVGGAVMILEVAEVPYAPVVGGAAVLGLAIAFGAQSLIKDYFVGFMILLEQQYLINDVVTIGDIKGQVERISLRITVLRDLEGRVHFIPHSQIDTVTNLTHGWSRALFEIGVAYKENVDHVIDVLMRLAHELRRDEAFRLQIIGDPVMLGVDALGDSAVVIKFYFPTRPLQQWAVKREMLRRIKNEFDRLGIEIPFPHLTLYRGSTAAPAQVDPDVVPQRDAA